MTVVRRELPRSEDASYRRSRVSHSSLEGSPFDSRPISSLGQGGPDETGEFAGHGGNDMLFGLAACGEPLIAAVQALLGAPGMAASAHRRAPF